MQIKNHCFVISGATSGLGEATARLLASQGGQVLLLGRNTIKGQALAQELQGKFFYCDLTRADTVEAACYSISVLGPVHGLIHCAGQVLYEKILNKQSAHSLENFENIIQVNLIGAFNLSRLIAELMSRNTPNAQGERGVIVHTASISGLEGQTGQTAYAASKAGIIGMTLPMARDLASRCIRVMTIAPGLFDTPLLKDMSQENKTRFVDSVPFPNRLGQPHEYAMLVQHILENPMLNGEVIRLDGAVRMQPR